MVPPMTKEEHLTLIYNALREISPYVRRSMLISHAVASEEDDTGRTVLWISSGHYLMATLKYNVELGSLGPNSRVYHANLLGISMLGFYEEDVKAVAALVWAEFLQDPGRYPVYAEESAPLLSPVVVADNTVNGACKIPPLADANDEDSDGWVTVTEIGGGDNDSDETITDIAPASLVGRQHRSAAAAAALEPSPSQPEYKTKSE